MSKTVKGYLLVTILLNLSFNVVGPTQCRLTIITNLCTVLIKFKRTKYLQASKVVVNLTTKMSKKRYLCQNSYEEIIEGFGHNCQDKHTFK